MNRKLIMCLMISALALSAYAQDEEVEEKKGFDKSKLFYGGNIGLGFGSNQTYVNVSPQVGYPFNRFFAAGAGINFIYSSYNYQDILGYKDQYGVIGLNIFGRAYPIQYIFAQVQPELNYTWIKSTYTNGDVVKDGPKFVPSLLVGGGAAIPIGGAGAMLVMIQYDLLQQPLNPYGSNAFLSIGFNF